MELVLAVEAFYFAIPANLITTPGAVEFQLRHKRTFARIDATRNFLIKLISYNR